MEGSTVATDSLLHLFDLNSNNLLNIVYHSGSQRASKQLISKLSYFNFAYLDPSLIKAISHRDMPEFH